MGKEVEIEIKDKNSLPKKRCICLFINKNTGIEIKQYFNPENPDFIFYTIIDSFTHFKILFDGNK